MSLHMSPEAQTILAARVYEGDRDAEDELAVLFGGRIRAMMLVRTRNRSAAEDLTQEALMAALVALRAGRLRANDRLAAFVYGVARNVANDYLRGLRPADVPIEPEMATAPHHDPVEERERETMVRRALDTLAPADRQILLLTLVEGLKPAAIAQRLGLGSEACRTRKTRALRKVVEEVEKLSRSGGRSDHPVGGGV